MGFIVARTQLSRSGSSHVPVTERATKQFGSLLLLLVAVGQIRQIAPGDWPWTTRIGTASTVETVGRVGERVLRVPIGAGWVQTAVLSVLSVLSALSAVLSLSLFVRHRAPTWQRPPLALGVAFAAGAIMIAVGSVATHGSTLLVPGLAASAIQAILTVVELWRQDRKHRAGRVAATEIVILELAGVAFLVGAAFVQTVTVAVAYAALAAILGLAVIGWGVLTRVRRRLAAGALIVLASLALLIAVPLVGLMPAWQGAALWVLIAAVGLVALLIASFLEQGKAVAHKGMSRFGEATAGWE